MTSMAVPEQIAWAVDGLAIELPSWGFVNTGTRFGVFPQAGAPRDVFEKIPAMIRSVMNLQESFAKALLVDREALMAAQAGGDVLEANRLLSDAFATDVREPLSALRQERGLPADPYRAYLGSGEDAGRAASRIGGEPAGWS